MTYDILTAVVNEQVIPLLQSQGVGHTYHETQSPGDAGVIGTTILKATPRGEAVSVVMAGGDGTAHELIEGVMAHAHGQAEAHIGRWELAILPLGTVRSVIVVVVVSGDGGVWRNRCYVSLSPGDRGMADDRAWALD